MKEESMAMVESHLRILANRCKKFEALATDPDVAELYRDASHLFRLLRGDLITRQRETYLEEQKKQKEEQHGAINRI